MILSSEIAQKLIDLIFYIYF